MNRAEIEELNGTKPYCIETEREQQWYEAGLVEGLEVADKEPSKEVFDNYYKLSCCISQMAEYFYDAASKTAWMPKIYDFCDFITNSDDNYEVHKWIKSEIPWRWEIKRNGVRLPLEEMKNLITKFCEPISVDAELLIVENATPKDIKQLIEELPHTAEADKLLISQKLFNEVVLMLAKYDKLNAIKFIKTLFDSSLYDAKRYFDELENIKSYR